MLNYIVPSRSENLSRSETDIKTKSNDNVFHSFTAKDSDAATSNIITQLMEQYNLQCF